MKNLRFFLIFLAISYTYIELAQAGEPYWKRSCRIAGGLYWALSLDRPDGAVLCRFGDAAVSAESFATYREESQSSAAVSVYFDMPNGAGCSAAGGRVRAEADAEGRNFVLCEFADGSYLELGTMQRGSAHPANAALTQALTNAAR